MYFIPSLMLSVLLDDLTGMGKVLAGAKLSLFDNDITPSKVSQFSDFTVFSANGFTSADVITWGTITVNGNGQAELLGNMQVYTSTSAPALPVNIYGYIITLADGVTLALAERFAAPYVLSRNNQQLALVPRLVLDT